MGHDSTRGVTVLFGGWQASPPYLMDDVWEWNGTMWTQRVVPGPEGRLWAAMAYDSIRGVTVLFGGRQGSPPHLLDDTWEWDGTTWTQRAVPGPAGRLQHAMAYDSIRGVTVLFGGRQNTPPDPLDDTWEWDGKMWTKRVVPGPTGRLWPAMAYDSARGVSVLFGGWRTGTLADTWEWNGAKWQLGKETTPNPRWFHAMAYDDTRGMTVLFGGTDYTRDTWEWDGERWRQVSDTGPSPRWWHAMAHDSRRGVTVLFGGYAGLVEGDTWEWDGESWALRSTTGPPPRVEHALAYDNTRGVMVLFGGRGVTGDLADTWEWDGNTWTIKVPLGESFPAARAGHRMAFDEQRGTVVLFGGTSGSFPYYPFQFHGDTWEWDGNTWALRSDSGPSPRRRHAMAYASDRHAVMLYGGEAPKDLTSRAVEDVWEWDGGQWHPLGDGPGPREGHAMVHDRPRGVLVLFGGLVGPRYQSDTWEFATCGDTDGDGVPDPDDACPNSDLGETVVIDGCDSGVANHLFEDGCTMADRIGGCAEGARNHGSFVSCVAGLTSTWVRDEIITSRDQGPIQRCAAQANLPEQTEGRVRKPKGISVSPLEALSKP